MASGSMKGFFKQKKNSSSISKSSSKSHSKASSNPSVSIASDHPKPTPQISRASLHLKDEHEEVLRQFDMNMAYGPCIGMTRLDRWERANDLGLNPPRDVEGLLKGGRVGLDCLWDGRV
ncbi:hypothetical protein HHK36_028330 [Tetracentron sinense]|uniref:DNA polymerase delta subunit 4 n=1 Tax=Tetracentron sinense TaxID=13715 RepID=A0A834YKW4_TETSI|nr:hypothetical protein HHK36_028330 [Tetracentron sinense]